MKFTYYTIIGKDLNLLSGQIRNIKEYAGFNKLPCEKEILVIVYKNKKIPSYTTNSILEFCKSEKIRTYIYNEPSTVFISNLYACWNLGYKLADKGYVFRGGSDQVFSKNSFLYLYNIAQELRKKRIYKFILQANTIENRKRLKQIGAYSRHFSLNLGDTFENFNYDAFEEFIKKINEGIKGKLLDINRALTAWGKPTNLTTSLGIIDRCDGCSWLMTKSDWEKHGPLPVIKNGITGDVLIHDSLQKAGYIEYIVKNCVTYHFVRGESMNKY